MLPPIGAFQIYQQTQSLNEYQLVPELTDNIKSDILQLSTNGAFWNYRQGGAIAPMIENQLSEIINEGVKIPDISSARNYMFLYPDIGMAVLDLYKDAKTEFYKTAQFSLEVESNLEDGEQWIALVVRLPKYKGSILDPIDKISKKFNERLQKLSGDLIFTTDYQYPK